MQTTTLLSIVSAILLLGLIAVAVLSSRAARSAREAGYDEGFEDADQSHAEHTNALHEELQRLRNAREIERQGHQQALDAIMQDADARIATYAARSLTADDLKLLKAAKAKLILAGETFSRLHADDHAQVVNGYIQRLDQLTARIEAALPPAVVEMEAAA